MRWTCSLMALLALAACGRTAPEGPKRLSPAAENRIRGQVFLAENAKKANMVVRASGLHYEILQAGTGEVPRPESIVKVHYRGMFIDGKEFESSRDRGQEPSMFQIQGLIRGWVEALTLMPVGSTWRIYVPSNLAYGLDRAPERIGPNQTLIFEIELLEIVKPKSR